ncbi:hypothetical protein B0H15DRAFT_805716 [Mycena belliarum]|uniref:Uncharacterized protein n=1 Tax=Mycena belliarum TaxID=1033014 RepID=A0AAD6XJV7_9AGAR|nr:hypothetical protein B0H15DRAFT_805716 [Mycena belliae]
MESRLGWLQVFVAALVRLNRSHGLNAMLSVQKMSIFRKLRVPAVILWALMPVFDSIDTLVCLEPAKVLFAFQYKAVPVAASNSAAKRSYQGTPAQAIPEFQPKLNPALGAIPAKVRMLEAPHARALFNFTGAGLKNADFGTSRAWPSRGINSGRASKTPRWYLPAAARCITGLYIRAVSHFARVH